MGRIIGALSREIISYLDRISRAWTAFWFTPRDPFSLSMMRCFVGWMAFYSTLVWGLDLESFIFPHGYNSAEMVSRYLVEQEGPYALSFWFWTPVSWIYPIHYLCLAITFCFMIGLWTRTTSILSLIILISYAYRARFSNYGLDQILTILTLYLCIAPSGAYLSVDRLIQRYRSLRKNLQDHLTAEPAPVLPTITTNIATRFVQFHMCVIYLAAGTGKLIGESWWDGSAMWRSLANAEYQTLDMTWLAYFPWFTQLMTHLTIFWEVSFAFLVWRPLTRPVVLLLGLGMHFGIGLFMGMWTFATCMMFGYFAFMEPQTLKACCYFLYDSLFGKSQTTLTIETPSEEAFRHVAWRKTWDAMDRISVVVAGRPSASTSTSDPEPSEPEHRKRAVALLLELHTESAVRTMAALQQVDISVRRAQSLIDLQTQLERTSQAGAIVNLDGMSERDVQDYLTSYLPLHMNDHPSLTILRSHQAHWLDEVERTEYQRILLLPCDQKDMTSEYQRAIHCFSEEANGLSVAKKNRTGKKQPQVVMTDRARP